MLATRVWNVKDKKMYGGGECVSTKPKEWYISHFVYYYTHIFKNNKSKTTSVTFSSIP